MVFLFRLYVNGSITVVDLYVRGFLSLCHPYSSRVSRVINMFGFGLLCLDLEGGYGL